MARRVSDRISVSLDEGARNVVDRVGNASGYVCQVLLRNAFAWRGAKARLLAAGWQPAGLAAACRELHGAWEMDGAARKAAVFDLKRRLRADGHACGSEPSDAVDADDVVRLAFEWWAQNNELRASIDPTEGAAHGGANAAG